jgi:hypothetical protein
LFIYDRLSAHQEEEGARNLRLQAEVELTADNVTNDTIARGNADYVLGYPYYEGRDTSGLESTLIVVEAKKWDTFDSGLSQCAGYLG